MRNPTNSGIEEQVQKGVIAPKSDAKKYSSQNSFLLVKKFLIFSIGKYEFKKVIKIIITIRSRIIFTLS
ncbi:MAG: hypothetical protein CO170_02170 [candidate division SR1 bacterium CG_4_9_14_3_um_filter_40_9]|nr:MAG: hypothetical protein CO170_02170 [candidate division SR1 bacterium CG_4_9_14_3_um_filter_40_9]